MKTRKGIVLGALSFVLAVGMFGCASAKEDKADDVAAKKEAAEQEESIADKEGSSTDQKTEGDTGESSSKGAGAYDFEDTCIDEHGNVTLYALTELKGWELATLLDQQGYVWNEDIRTWMRPEDGASYAALKESGEYAIDDYNAANEKGGGILAFGFSNVAGYKDAESALAGNAQCVVEDSVFEGEDGAAIIYGPSMKEYLVLISKATESTHQFMVVSQEAIGSGYLDEVLGEPVGGTLQEVWTTLTGEEYYGQ
ncbi:MAG: hypothetical protein ACI4B9_07165 [Eggerthellaceae bacterium]